MAIYWPTPGLKGRTFKLCVLTRWDLISASAAPHCGTLHADWTSTVHHFIILFTSVSSTGDPEDTSVGRLAFSVLLDFYQQNASDYNSRCPQLNLNWWVRVSFARASRKTPSTQISRNTWQHPFFSLEFSTPCVHVCITGVTSFIIMVTEFIPYYVCKYNIYRQFQDVCRLYWQSKMHVYGVPTRSTCICWI